MKKGNLIFSVYAAAAMMFMVHGSLYPEPSVKLRDVMYIDGFKENQVLGFGLVVGLQGSGDSKSAVTQNSLKNILSHIGLESAESFSTKNIAAVLVTAKLPPYARIGDRIDVSVSSIGDAKSLEGGTLVQSALKGADDRVYVAAQGPLSISVSGKGGKEVKTAARIIGGGMVERDIEPDYIAREEIKKEPGDKEAKNIETTKIESINIVLKIWDFSAADQVIKAVSAKYPESKPSIVKGGKINIVIPKDIAIAEFISSIENIEITPAATARVIINEKDGTIVTGGDVKISQAMVSKEGITVRVETGKQTAKDGTGKANAAVLKESSTIKDLVDSLNYIGASTRDIIAILKALKEAGALHAELIIR
jgi:flagellar P-ring protein precursor FlgI